jgi:hypothetical protein
MRIKRITEWIILCAAMSALFLLPLQATVAQPQDADYRCGFDAAKLHPDAYITVLSDTPAEIPVSGYERALSSRYPEMLSRLRGMADALELKLDEVLKARIYVSQLLTESLGACTCVAAAPPATTGGIYSAWNMDLFYLLKLFPVGGWLPLLTVVEPPDGYRYIQIGIPVLAGIGLLNEKGLSCVVNAVPVADGGEGLLHMDLIAMAMESCSHAYEAEELIKGQERFSPGPGVPLDISEFLCLNMQFVDAEGGIAAIEYSHNHFAAFHGEDGISAQTNLHQFLDPALTGCPVEEPAMMGTTMRLYRAWDLVRENRGSIDLDTIESIMTDRAIVPLPEETDPDRYSENPQYQQSISRAPNLQLTCRRYLGDEMGLKDLLKSVAMAGGTVFSLIIEPERKIIHWSVGLPDVHGYTPIYCADLLRSEGTRGTNWLTAFVRVSSGLGHLIYVVPVCPDVMAMSHGRLVKLLIRLGS